MDSLALQDFRSDQIAVYIVDNDSTDHTRRVVHEIGFKYPERNIFYLHEPIQGSLAARHCGALKSEGDLLIYIDDDVDLDRKWLKSIVKAFDDPFVQLAGGKNLPKYAFTPPSWVEGFWEDSPYGGKYCISLSLLDLGEKPLVIDANYIWTLNFAIRRKAFFELGGFHPDIYPSSMQKLQGDGETGLTRKANERAYRAVYAPEAIVHHRIPSYRLTPEYFGQRAFFQGVSDSFTTIRLDGAVVPYKLFLKNVKFYIRQSINYVRDLTKNTLFKEETQSIDQLKIKMTRLYHSGYMFHQCAVRSDKNLLQWVLRNDYWDYQNPEI